MFSRFNVITNLKFFVKNENEHLAKQVKNYFVRLHEKNAISNEKRRAVWMVFGIKTMFLQMIKFITESKFAHTKIN